MVDALGGAQHDPAPFTLRQAGALGGAVSRELRRGLLLARRERAVWRQRATTIPDPALRADALDSLSRKQHYSDGAGLFWTIPRRADPELLRLLVTFQIAADYLDLVSERAAAHDDRAPAGTLLQALLDAVDVDRPLGDYYADHPWTDDGGYLAALVGACRSRCRRLDGYAAAQPLLVREAQLTQALELEHDPIPDRRDRAFARFAAEIDDQPAGATPSELIGSASSALTVLAVLALAHQGRPLAELRAATSAYRRVGALAALLDGYVDQFEDAASGAWNSNAYFASVDEAVARAATVLDGALRAVGALENGERHLVIVSTMAAMYLSHDVARSAPLDATTSTIVDAGGSLTALLVPALRLWRRANGQRAA